MTRSIELVVSFIMARSYALDISLLAARSFSMGGSAALTRSRIVDGSWAAARSHSLVVLWFRARSLLMGVSYGVARSRPLVVSLILARSFVVSVFPFAWLARSSRLSLVEWLAPVCWVPLKPWLLHSSACDVWGSLSVRLAPRLLDISSGLARSHLLGLFIDNGSFPGFGCLLRIDSLIFKVVTQWSWLASYFLGVSCQLARS
jgi:hypothetical protein